MSLKSRLRFSIVALVSLIVIGVSGLYLDDFASLAFEQAATRAEFVSKQIRAFLSLRLRERTEGLETAQASDLPGLWGQLIATDAGVAKVLEQAVANADT